MKHASRMPWLDSTKVVGLDTVDLGYLITLLAISIYSKSTVLNYLGTDDGIYTAGCGLIMNGYQPYRDYFLAHPPAFFYLISTIWRLMQTQDGYSMWHAGKWVVIAFFSAYVVLTYAIAKSVFKSRTAGIISTLLLHLSCTTFRFSIQVCPSIPTAFLIVLATFLLLTNHHPATTGVTLGIACLTRLTPLAIFPVMAYYYYIKRPRDAFIFAASTGLPLLALAAFPVQNILFDLFSFHLRKGVSGPLSIQHLKTLLDVATSTEIPILAGLIGSIICLVDRRKERVIVAVMGLMLMVPYLVSSSITPHLLREATPMLSLSAALALSEVTGKGNKRHLAILLGLVLLSSSLSVKDGIQDAMSEYSKAANSSTHKISYLVRLVQENTRPEDMVFCQLTVVPFLANRRSPPLADTSLTAMRAGVFTLDSIKAVIHKYDIRLLSISDNFVDEEDMRQFLRDRGYVRIDRAWGYWTYVKLRS